MSRIDNVSIIKESLFNHCYCLCVLAPKLTSKLIQSIVGIHGSGDMMTKYFPNAKFLQIPSLNPNINIIDFAHTAFGKECLCPIHIDDENTWARDVQLIKNGQIHECMTDKKSAEIMSLPLTGNARSAGVGKPPEVHFRNFALLPGKDNHEDMLNTIKEGYYLVDGFGTEISEHDEFACHVNEAYEIKNSVIGKKINPAMIWGFGIDFLQSITLIGDDFKWFIHDEYEKRTGIRSSIGAPHILARVNIEPDPFY